MRLMSCQEKSIEQQKEEITQQRDNIEIQKVELEKLSIVASQTNNAIMIMDPKGNFQWLNKAFTNIFGFTLDEYNDKYNNNIVNASSHQKIRIWSLYHGGQLW